MNNLSFLDPKSLSAVVAAIRKSFSYNSIEVQLALHRGKSEELGPRGGARYYCAGTCGGKFGRGDIFIDHIEPVVPIDTELSEMSLETLYRRCFTDHSNLQLLCDACHSVKTKAENAERKKYRQLRRPKIIKSKLKVA